MVLKVIIIVTLCFNILSYAQNKITIGTIDSEPQEKIFQFQAIADYLEKELKNKNITIDVEIPKDTKNAIDFIKNGKLDIFIDSVYSTIEVQKSTGITIESKRWKNNQEGYRSFIFVKSDSQIDSIKKLQGKTIAFEDSFSTSSYFIPKKAIEAEGLTVSNKDKKENVNFIYSKSENNTVAWVLFSKVDAGAIDDDSFKKFDQKMFKIIYKSKKIPRHLVSFSNRIDPQLKKEILDILYNMDKNDSGKEVLKEFSRTKKFTPLNSDDIDMIKSF